MLKNVVSRSGAWFNYGDVRLGQGRNNSKQFLVENKEVAANLEAELRRVLELPVPGDAEDDKAGEPADKK